MAEPYPPTSPEQMAYLEALNKSVNALAKEVQFLLGLNQKTLLILIKQAYLLERIANKVYGLKDDEPIEGEQVETEFKEIRDLFEAQQALLQGGVDDDGSE